MLQQINDFFKPNIFKMFMLLMLILLTSIFPRYTEGGGYWDAEKGTGTASIERVRGYGLPTFYKKEAIRCQVPEESGPVECDYGWVFSIPKFLFNVIYFYFISCFIYFLVVDLKKRKEKEFDELES